jgi:crossover junction endodeoxyribonuclease RuvC
MGIDPGLRRTGFAVVEDRAGRLAPLTFGTVRPAAGAAEERLRELRAALDAVSAEHAPESVAVERLFVNQNRLTATRVGQASGVALLVAAERGLKVFEYTPSEVKRGVVGVGTATKAQVAYMVKAILGLHDIKLEPDAADALALAICHLHGRKLKEAAAR